MQSELGSPLRCKNFAIYYWYGLRKGQIDNKICIHGITTIELKVEYCSNSTNIFNMQNMDKSSFYYKLQKTYFSSYYFCNLKILFKKNNSNNNSININKKKQQCHF